MAERGATARKTVKVPGPDHPIAVQPNARRIMVRLAGRMVADTRRALTLAEASYPAVHYIPRADVDMAVLERTEHATYCPYKGECSYFSLASGGARGINAAWSYEAPYPAVEAIKDHIAFYPDRVEVVELPASEPS